MGETTLGIVRVTVNQYNADAYYGCNWRLQQNNAPPHTAQSTMDWLANNVPALLEWPANSPDLSPIETLWGIMKDMAEKHTKRTAAEFEAEVVQIWTAFEQDMLSRLVQSMPVHLCPCRDARGGIVNLHCL